MKRLYCFNEQFSDVSYWERKYITKKEKLLYHDLNLWKNPLFFLILWIKLTQNSKWTMGSSAYHAFHALLHAKNSTFHVFYFLYKTAWTWYTCKLYWLHLWWLNPSAIFFGGKTSFLTSWVLFYRNWVHRASSHYCHHQHHAISCILRGNSEPWQQEKLVQQQQQPCQQYSRSASRQHPQGEK